MPEESLERFLHALPKVELHCHLYGAVRHQTFRDLAAQVNAPLTAEEIDAFYTRGEKPVGVLRVLRALDRHLIRAPGDLHRITYEYLQDARAHGVRYAEFFWNPTGTVRDSGIGYAAAQDAIVQAIRDAGRDLDIVGRLIPSIDREASAAEAVEMVQMAAAHRAPEVIGIGIDYNEVERPPELFWKAYRDARRAGFRTTAHAGEFGTPWTNVETAIELLQVDRIDHGYTVLDNPELVQRCIDRGLVFTVVPTNSYYLRTLPPERWALDHPIRRMVALGLRVHPNTDDPTLHQVTPTQAWLMMSRDFGFGLDALKSFMLNGLDAAWIDDETRRRWRGDWSAQFDHLRAATH
ncbi:MAG: adenosine deaminase [Acidovorax sp.]